MSDKPNCYECKWRGTIPGTAHSCCKHPASGTDGVDAFGGMMAMFASVGRVPPVIGAKAAALLDVTGNLRGIRSGWFNWPFHFDPTWLETCNGYTPKGGDENAATATVRDGVSSVR